MQKSKLVGSIEVPGDKSISHRVLIFASFCKGISKIEGLSPAQDCVSTANCLRSLGLKINDKENNATKGKRLSYITVEASGIKQLSAPKNNLFVGNSGTTIRLLSGLLSGQAFSCQLDGDESIRRRPMARVLQHLEEMGAHINYIEKEGLAPFTIRGGNLEGKEFKLKVASAQVQTAILLAGLQAAGKTTVHLPGTARDHTTRLFSHIGIPFQNSNGSISVEALASPIKPFQYKVPADISSAAFFMVAAACLPGSKLILTNVGINSGRTLIIDVLKRMGANITLLNARIIANEPIADIEIIGEDQLVGTEVFGNEIASGVDEIPVLALAGAFCKGNFVVRDASELRHKESDRLQLITNNLKAAGAEITESEDGFTIVGKRNIPGGSFWQTHLDHRLAMSGLIANLLFDSPLKIEETGSTAISYPNFAQDLSVLTI
jgi:3-phosphoshikimate 1-carboxyvinyltransferase